MKNKLDFSKYLILQKQFSVLSEKIAFGKNRETDSIEDFLDELEWAIYEHCEKDNEKITDLFDELKNLIGEAKEEILGQSKKYLKTWKQNRP